jgi:hypothetical protein
MMTRDECIQVFRKYGFTEEQIVNISIQILGAQNGTMVELKGLPMKAFLDTSLNVVYNGGKRYNKLEEAIKTFVTM